MNAKLFIKTTNDKAKKGCLCACHAGVWGH